MNVSLWEETASRRETVWQVLADRYSREEIDASRLVFNLAADIAFGVHLGFPPAVTQATLTAWSRGENVGALGPLERLVSDQTGVKLDVLGQLNTDYVTYVYFPQVTI